MRRAVPAVLGVAVLLFGGGCKPRHSSADPSPAPPSVIRLGAAHPSGHKVPVVEPTACFRDVCDYLDPDAWPKACDLLTEDEIRAVLPGTGPVDTQTKDQQIITTGSIGDRETLGYASASICEFTVHQGTGDISFTVTVRAVGTSDVVRKDYLANRQSAQESSTLDDPFNLPWTVVDRTDLGPNGCYAEVPPSASAAAATSPPSPSPWDPRSRELSCYRGPVEFELEGPRWSDLSPPVTVERTGHRATFTDRSALDAYLTDTAAADLVRTMNAALS